MAKLRDLTRVTVNGKRPVLDPHATLEEQTRAVHSALLVWARINGGTTYRLEGHAGVKAHLNLTSVVRIMSVDMEAGLRTRLQNAISQVLRRTGAAVCLHRHNAAKNEDPVWFVAFQLPENLVIISHYVASRSAGVSSSPPGFAEKDFLSPRERKLLPDEVGENLPAGEVTVTKRQLNLTDEDRAHKAAKAKEIFADRHEENRRKRAELTEQVYEFIATAPVTMTHPELAVLFNREMDTEWHKTTFRNVLRDLEDAGRIASHKETADERLVRGGGHTVKATSPKIYHLPGEDTPRTRLPKGIEPLKSSEQWAADKKKERRSVEDLVFKAMDVPNTPGSGHGAPRTPHMIARAADISDREALEALERLVACGRVFYHPTVHYYAPMTRVRQSTIDKYSGQPMLPEPETELEPEVHTGTSAMPQAPLPQAVVGLSPARQDKVAGIMEAVLDLAQGPADQSDEVETLRQENIELKREVDRLGAAVQGLRQTLEALS